MRIAICAAALLLTSCGRAELGAASVRGHLYGTSFDFIAPVTVEGAGPFRVTIEVPDEPSERASSEVVPGRSIVLQTPLLPASGEVVQFGHETLTAAVAQVSRVTPGAAERQGERIGADVRFPDGSFIARPVRGELRVEFEGREPGSGITGRFQLEFQSGERIEGDFASALSN